MRIAIVGAVQPELERVCTHWTGIAAALNRMPHEWKMFCCRSDLNFVERIMAYKPDLVLYGLIDMAENQEARERIRKELPNAKIVFWYGDCRTEDTGQDVMNIAGTVDLFITSNIGQRAFDKAHFGMTSQFVPLAAEPIQKPDFHPKAAYDFMFIGGSRFTKGYEARMRVLADLKENHGLKQLNGTTGEERTKMYKAMPKLYSSSRFCLDISHFWDIEGYTSNRFWVIPANFGFALTRRFPGCEKLVPETHHVYWDSKEDLFEKMEYYREHEDERQEMIQKGWQYAKDHHTYEHRINRIIELL